MATTSTENGRPPWLKRVLVPLWTLQICFSVILIGLLAFYVSFSARNFATVNEISGVVYLVLNVVCLAFDIAEIILFARGLLRPGAFLGLNIAKTALWTITLILAIISVFTAVSVHDGDLSWGIVFLVFIFFIFLAFLGSLIYASVIYNRHMKAKRAAKANGISLEDKAENGSSPTSAFSGHTYIETKMEKAVPNNGMGVVEAGGDEAPTTFEKDGKSLPPKPLAELDSPEDYCGGGAAREFGGDEVYELPSSPRIATRPKSTSKFAPASARLLTRQPVSSSDQRLRAENDKSRLSAADAAAAVKREHERGRRRT